MDENILFRLAKQFRQAIEKYIEVCSDSTILISLEKFPCGSCRDASLLLGKWLKENNEKDFLLVSGERNFLNASGERDFKTHAWLERDGIAVDITADQFRPELPPVLVGPRSSFHCEFSIEEEPLVDFESYGQRTTRDLCTAYSQIRKMVVRD